MDVVSATILLILVMDPFGNMPLVISVLKNVEPRARTRVVLRECAIAYGVLLAFMFGGDSFMHLLRLSDNALAIAGGLILFLIALRMVFPHAEGIFGEVRPAATPAPSSCRWRSRPSPGLQRSPRCCCWCRANRSASSTGWRR